MARPRDPEERAKRVAQFERKAQARRFVVWGVTILIGLALVAGLAFAISHAPKPPRDVHWHAKYQVWVDDQQVSFANARFDGSQQGTSLYLPAHMHSPEFDVIHNEGKEGAGTMGKFMQFGITGGLLTDNELVIPQGASLAATGQPFNGDFKVGGNKTLQMFVSHLESNTTWTPVTSNLGGYSFHDGDRILVLYGDYTPDRVKAIQDQFPAFDPTKVGAAM